MNSNSPNAGTGIAYSDGLDETAIDQLIAQVATEVSESPTPTSSLVDGSAAERRRRRIERRMLAAVVRSLLSGPAIAQRAGEAA